MNPWSLLLLMVIQSSWAMSCPEDSRPLYKNESKSLEVCASSRSFYLKSSSLDLWEKVPPVGFSSDATIYERVVQVLGPKLARSEFRALYEQAMDQYFENLRTRVFTTMATDQVNAINLINEADLGGALILCDESIRTFSILPQDITPRISQMRCQVSASRLPESVLKEIPVEKLVTGKVNLRTLVENNPDLRMTMRSRVSSKSRELTVDTPILTSDFVHFDLVLEGQEGPVAIGNCIDFDEDFFSHSLKQEPEISYEGIGEGEQGGMQGMSAYLAESWRIPFSVDMEEEVLRDEEGQSIDAMNFGLNTGVLFEHEYRRGRSLQIVPEVGIPLLEGITSPGDVLRGNGFRTPVPDTFRINVFVRF